MKIIYIAGKYSGKTNHEIFINIQVARNEAEFVWSQGGVAICPHLNSAWMSGLCPEENFLKGDLEIVMRCDAVYTCWNWKDSAGAKEEVRVACVYNRAVLHSRVEVMEYLKFK